MHSERTVHFSHPMRSKIRKAKHFRTKKPKTELGWDYSRALTELLKKFLPHCKFGPGNIAELRLMLEELAGCITGIPFSGRREKGFFCIGDICMLYPNPLDVLGKFRDSYKVIKRVADDAKAGRTCPVASGKEREMDEFLRKVRGLASADGLQAIRESALLEIRKGVTTYEIEFLDWGAIERISEDKLRSSWSF